MNLPKELNDKAISELNEPSTIDERNTIINSFRDRIMTLPQEERYSDVTDISLIRFLRSSKYNMDKAIDMTINITKFYKQYHNELKDINPAIEFNDISRFLIVLKQHDRDGRVVVVLQPGQVVKIITPDFRAKYPYAFLRFRVWLFERLSWDYNVQVNGIVLLASFHGITLYDALSLKQIAPISHHRAVFQYLHLLGLRFGGAYLFEAPTIVHYFLLSVKTFMSQKMAGRFHLCSNNYNICNDIVSDVSILPVKFGGKYDNTTDGNAWFEKNKAYSISM
jgi:hypothetical protein